MAYDHLKQIPYNKEAFHGTSRFQGEIHMGIGLFIVT